MKSGLALLALVFPALLLFGCTTTFSGQANTNVSPTPGTTVTSTVTVTPYPTATFTPTPYPTPTPTTTPTPTPTPTPSPTITPTPTVTLTPSPTAYPTINVGIQGSSFVQPIVGVYVGQVVRFTNYDSMLHSVVFNTVDKQSGLLGAGQQYEVSFDAPGTYDYHCGTHPTMTGRIIVNSP